ncbi:MAG TPA: hypothetical protein GXX75_07550 [Clostridiales bacterium]|nr:hypothetical protein [Clostridiales bacterium]
MKHDGFKLCKGGLGNEYTYKKAVIGSVRKLSKVMISCDKDNIASRQTIISCGGILTGENYFKDEEQQIFWINLAKGDYLC